MVTKIKDKIFKPIKTSLALSLDFCHSNFTHNFRYAEGHSAHPWCTRKKCQMCKLSWVWEIYIINVCDIDMTSIDDTIDTKKEIPEVYSSTKTCFNKPGNQAF